MIKIENNILYKFFLSLLIITFFIHFIIISFFLKDVGSDNAIWHYIGWNWFNYKDIQEINIIDNKPPGIHYLYYLTSKYFEVNFFTIKNYFYCI